MRLCWGCGIEPGIEWMIRNHVSFQQQQARDSTKPQNEEEGLGCLAVIANDILDFGTDKECRIRYIVSDTLAMSILTGSS
jgi:hypothetical protein